MGRKVKDKGQGQVHFSGGGTRLEGLPSISIYNLHTYKRLNNYEIRSFVMIFIRQNGR